MATKLKQVIMRIPEDDWKLFKEVARENGANASVEIRKFIKDYLAKNTKTITKLLKEKGGENELIIKKID
jgi:hypothetical protein